MAVYKRADVYWYEFIFAEKRVRESAKTKSKTVAKIAEQNRRRELEKALSGMPMEDRNDRILSVNDLISRYLSAFAANHRPNTVISAQGCLAHVRRLLGNRLLPDLNE